MRINIQIDLIFIQNIIINYILITQTEILIATKTSIVKKLSASFIGASYVVIMLIYKIKSLDYLIAKIMLVFIIIYIAFMPKKTKRLIKQTYIFLIISTINVGTINILKQVVNLHSNEIYIEIIIYTLSFLISKQIAIRTWRLYKHRLKSNNLIYNVKIKLYKSTLSYKAFLDTGNTVTSKGKNIIFARESKEFKKEKQKLKKIKILVKTISSSKGYTAYIPKKVMIEVNQDYRKIQSIGVVFLEDAMFTNQEYNMILNNNIFEDRLGGISL